MSCSISHSSPRHGRATYAPGTHPGACSPWTGKALLAPVRLREDDPVRGGDLLRQHDLGRAALPLGKDELLFRRAGLVPTELPEDRLHGILVQVVGDRVLVDFAHLLN